MRNLLLFIALLTGLSYGANITWLGTSASAKTAANWVGGVLPATGDVWVLSSTNNLALTVDSNFTNAGVSTDAGYTATVSLQSYTVTSTGDVNLGGATLARGTSTLSLTGTAAQTITSAGETWYDITINRSTAGTCLFSGAVVCNTITASATNTQVISFTTTTLSAGGNFTFDGTGTHVFGTALTMTGASSKLHIGSTLTTPSAASCAITMNTSTAGVIDDDIVNGVTINQLVLGANAVVTNSGSGSNFNALATNNPLVFTNGGTLTLISPLTLGLSANGSFYSIAGSPTIDGSTPSFQFRVAINGVTGTIPAITVGGTVGIRNLCSTTGISGTFSLAGNVSCVGNYMMFASRANATHTFNGNTFGITCAELQYGAYTDGTCVGTYNFGSGTYNIASLLVMSILGVTNVNLQTSTINCSGNWTFGSNYTVTPATSIVRLTPGAGATATVTSNGKHFANFRVIGNATGTVTLGDSLYADSAFTDSTGLVNQNTKSIYCKALGLFSPQAITNNAVITATGNIETGATAPITQSGAGKILSTRCVTATLNGNSVRIYYPAVATIAYADAPWTDTVGKTSTHAVTLGCALGKDSIVTITALPAGYSYSKTTGLISWAGTGTAQASANYTIRAYANAKTDSASVTVGIVIAAPVTLRRRGGASLDFGFGFNF